MPIYEYICSDCKHKFELLRPLSRSNEGASCPKCHNSAKRALSNFCCVSKGESGVSTPVGGSSCGGCGATNCGSCGV